MMKSKICNNESVKVMLTYDELQDFILYQVVINACGSIRNCKDAIADKRCEVFNYPASSK